MGVKTTNSQFGVIRLALDGCLQEGDVILLRVADWSYFQLLGLILDGSGNQLQLLDSRIGLSV